MPDIFAEHKTNQSQPPAQPTLNPIQPTPTPLEPLEAKHDMNILSSFAEYPADLSFNQIEPNEQIILFLRRHFITNLSWITGTLILSLIPLLILLMLQTINLTSLILPTHFLFIILTFYYLIVIGYSFANFINWFYNIGLVTNKRIMDIDFTNLSSIDVAATAVQDIQDVHYTQKGFAQQFYNYGDIYLQTDAKTQNFTFEKSPKPAQASNIISQLIGGK